MIYNEWFDFENKRMCKEEFDTLSEGLELSGRENPVITVVGAGGKTTLIKKLAGEFAAEGKRVLVTTTTHMPTENGRAPISDMDEIEKTLESEGICFVGTADGGEMGALPDDVWTEAAKKADVVLVEGDGAKKHPLKYPAEYEPVIPRETTDIIILAGITAMSEEMEKACCRPELALSELGIRPDAEVSDNIIALIMIFAYLEPLEARYPEIRIQCVINQADNEGLFRAACKTKRFLRQRRCIITSFSEEERE